MAALTWSMIVLLAANRAGWEMILFSKQRTSSSSTERWFELVQGHSIAGTYGFHVTAVQLPLTSVADDVATVKRAMELDPGPLRLVGHSYGGVVIAEAGTTQK